MSEMDKQAVSYNPHGATFHSGSTAHNTRPAPDTPEELIWLRGFEAGVIRCRADRNQVIQELIEKAESDGAVYAVPIPTPKWHDPMIVPTVNGPLSEWLKSQMEGE